MSKWIIFPGLGLLAVSTAFWFLQGLIPVLGEWYWPLMQAGIVLTIGGCVLLVFRGK